MYFREMSLSPEIRHSNSISENLLTCAGSQMILQNHDSCCLKVLHFCFFNEFFMKILVSSFFGWLFRFIFIDLKSPLWRVSGSELVEPLIHEMKKCANPTNYPETITNSFILLLTMRNVKVWFGILNRDHILDTDD